MVFIWICMILPRKPRLSAQEWLCWPSITIKINSVSKILVRVFCAVDWDPKQATQWNQSTMGRRSLSREATVNNSLITTTSTATFATRSICPLTSSPHKKLSVTLTHYNRPCILPPFTKAQTTPPPNYYKNNHQHSTHLLYRLICAPIWNISSYLRPTLTRLWVSSTTSIWWTRTGCRQELGYFRCRVRSDRSVDQYWIPLNST